jgi:hypothetical protein
VIKARDENVNIDCNLSPLIVIPDVTGRKQAAKDVNPWLECLAWNLLLSKFLSFFF